MQQRNQLQQVPPELRAGGYLTKILIYEIELLGTVDSVVKLSGNFYFTTKTVAEELLKGLQFFWTGFLEDQSPLAELLAEQGL